MEQIFKFGPLFGGQQIEDVLADGSNQLDLPTIPNCESREVIPVLNRQDMLPGECEEFEVRKASEAPPAPAPPALALPELPELPVGLLPALPKLPELPELQAELLCCQKHKRNTFSELPYLRTSAFLDIPTIATQFGQDLLSVPTSWLDEGNGRRSMQACQIATNTVPSPCFFA